MDGTWVQYLILSWVVVGMIGGLIASTKGHTGFRQGLILVLLGPFGVVQAIRLRKTSEAEARSTAAARRREPKPGVGCAVMIISVAVAAVLGFSAWVIWMTREGGLYEFSSRGLSSGEVAAMIALAVAAAAVLVGGLVGGRSISEGSRGRRRRHGLPTASEDESPPTDPEDGTG